MSRISETWHPTAGFHCWGHVRGRKHCQCQAELLDSPMAASLIRSVNVGQDDPDTKERLSRISFRYEGRSLQSNSVGSSAGGEGRYAQPYPSDDGEQSADLHIQKTDVTLQGGRCPADQPSNVTAVGRPHVSTPEAFSKAATPIYIFHYFKDRSISSSISARPARGAFIKRSD